MYIPNLNICYKFTRTQLHKLFSHFVSSINQTMNRILNILSVFENNCGNILMRICDPDRDSKTLKLKIMKCTLQTLIFIKKSHELILIHIFYTLYQV